MLSKQVESLRIVINPDKVSDDEATLMSREVAKKIEDTMQYPGQIKLLF